MGKIQLLQFLSRSVTLPTHPRVMATGIPIWKLNLALSCICCVAEVLSGAPHHHLLGAKQGSSRISKIPNVSSTTFGTIWHNWISYQLLAPRVSRLTIIPGKHGAEHLLDQEIGNTQINK